MSETPATPQAVADLAAQLVEAIRSSLREASDPALAPGMQAYMKSALPFLGVRVPEVRRIVRGIATTAPPIDLMVLRSATETLWRNACHREERYAAIALTGLPPARGVLELFPLYQEMIVSSAWWDHVDEVSHRVGDLLYAHPESITPVIRTWSTSDDRWLRRVSVICQLDGGPRTDLALLTDAIEANASDPDFFLRKAIGWALRQYARTDPAWVRTFVHSHQLSPLSRREATKHL